MKRVFRMALTATAVLAGLVGISSKASAAPIAAICNDIACTGGDDFFVTDNGAGDTAGAAGVISFSTTAFGYSFLLNTSQTKPIIGSAGEPQMDLNFTATSNAAGGGNVFLYMSDTDFTGVSGPFALSVGGTNSGGSGTVTSRAWGGTNNTAMSFSGANLFGNTGALSGITYSSLITGVFTPSVNPYSLTIGVAINRSTAGTTTGDLNLTIQPVPEPASMMLLGTGLLGLVSARRRRAAKA